ncbi:hypothetical protein A3J90_02825 [candidate division WOR-1 bacterium RIFOXYC2_FULL_37_10]|uniref:Bacterial type II secretion system protein E domain-containing protein n=1 Tax=candidate division WOR-1 bacterium RIFOXYB2_FULL_37_13 TaxID=1802579 RepID=A0A1F4SPA4_UNCSA|nr:MAG: hypothetical protein A2310_01505 [candidate division WOR-1 bacterium RIFOXYB2_FULL_37_13]OGC34547.1 MAG: hypothetical protein A3J90_02825 [candidate division WOR-1 bacterium RIFOXYC2_FULL_37_10]
MTEKKRDLRKAFVECGLLTEEQIKEAVKEGQKTGETLIKSIIKKRLLDEKTVIKFLEEEMYIPHINLSSYLIDQKTLSYITPETAKKYGVIPLFLVGNSLSIGMIDPFDIKAIDDVRRESKFDVEAMAATPSEINQAIMQYYGVSGTLEELLAEVSVPESSKSDVPQIEEESPVSKLVNLVVTQAIQERASDIHIEPEEHRVRIRYRIDGILQEASSPPSHLHASLVSRIKIMSALDIAESRIPQDGRFSYNIEGRDIDVRVSTCPTIHGEAVVLRLLDKHGMLLSLKDMGFAPENLKLFQTMIKHPYGVILVTGPTGSGKTTTLYAALTDINTPDRNILTIEDPVEYELPGIRQSQVNPKAGLIFGTALRSLMRQDPDVILVGEIRDLETSGVAIEAALTGHLVFSTLHTNDAAGALTRLTDMGVEPFLTSSATVGVVAQRLIRKICDNCKEEIKLPGKIIEDIPFFKDKKFKFYHGKGCNACRDTGYRGRTGIFEMFTMNEEVRQLVIARQSTSRIKEAALKTGMKTLYEDGLLKVTQGVTTLDEVMRVTQLD